ncbi:N-acetylmuramoyl-L-alanine amidase [Tenacibaculum sp. 190524A05c]|uniref:N-acetylmuramoyl-L-alanine amidase n=1 Tax=Tenacibaculum platacis TaxID=3137852 RepID=UPI0031FB33DC
MKKMTFGEKLIEIRKTKGFTQSDVANKCNISLRTIQRIESGTVTPRSYTIKVISESLGFDYFEAPANPKLNPSVKALQNIKFHLALFFKDLFNLKTNTLMKISILSLPFLFTGLAFFLFNSKVTAQSSEHIPAIQKSNSDFEYLKNIRVVFTSELEFEDLFRIKEELKKEKISITYNKIIFDDDKRLKSIDCNVDWHNGASNSLIIEDLKSIKKGEQYGFYRNYDKNSKILCGSGLLPKIVVLDIGHGGIDSGSFSEELSEKQITLEIGNKVKDLLYSNPNMHIDISLTRTSDKYITLKNRIDYINSLQPDYIISLHLAESKTENENGINLFNGSQTPFIKQSDSLLKQLKISFSNEFTINQVKSINSDILNKVNCPSALVEMGYLTNKKDIQLFKSEIGKSKIASAIFNTIKQLEK